MGNTLAVYADMTEKGYVEKGLKWGDFKLMAELIEKTARNEEGFEIFGFGAHYVAKVLGDEYYAPSVKNISIQNTDPRAEIAWGLVNAVESFGGGVHIWVYPSLIKSFEDLGVQTIYKGEPSFEELASRIYRRQVEVAGLDSLGVCAFSSLALNLQDYVDGLTAFHGVKFEENDLIEAGMSCLGLERYLNELYGFDLKSDGLPKKFVETPLPSGKHSGATCPIDELLKPYHKLLKNNYFGKISCFPSLT